MAQIIRKCKKHGDLRINDIYTPPGRPKEKNCRFCRKENSDRNRLRTIPDSITQRTCSRCKTIKSKAEFKPYQWKLTSPYCIPCREANSTKDYHKNRSHLKIRYGLSVERFEQMLVEHNYRCAICKNKESFTSNKKDRSPKRLSVDHCHTTGKVRGILCQRCNQGLGSFCENKDYLLRACEYLALFTADMP